MARAFTVTGGGSPRAAAAIRRNNDGTVQNLNESIPDGDTIAVHIAGSAAVRFLGIDTPEKSFQQPLGGGAALNGEPWCVFRSILPLSPDEAFQAFRSKPSTESGACLPVGAKRRWSSVSTADSPS